MVLVMPAIGDSKHSGRPVSRGPIRLKMGMDARLGWMIAFRPIRAAAAPVSAQSAMPSGYTNSDTIRESGPSLAIA